MKHTYLRRFLVCVLLLAFVFTMVACGSGGKTSVTESSGTKATGESADDKSAQTESSEAKKIDIWAKYDPVITITSVKSVDSMTESADLLPDANWENNAFTRGYLDKLGIDFKWLWRVPENQYEQKLGVAIASNQLPDITSVNEVQLLMIVKSGMAADMTQHYKDYISPFTKEMMEGDGGMGLSQATFDGKLMAIPQASGNTDHASVLYIRKDWLDNLGMSAPKTTDEFLELVEAFATKDPNKSGKNDTYGLALGQIQLGEFRSFLNPFGAVTGFKRDEAGELVSGLIQKETKTALLALQNMYKNKWIDQEFGIKDGGKVAETIVSGKVGMLFGWQWNPFWPLPDANANDPKADWRAYPIPSPDGESPLVEVGKSAGLFFVISNKCKNPEAAIKMLNLDGDYRTYFSPDYDHIYHTGTRDPENPTEPMPGVVSPGFRFGAVNIFSPTQNIDIYRDNMILLETGDKMATKTSKNLRDADIEMGIARMKLERQLGYIPYPESEETIEYENPDGTKEVRPVFRAEDWAPHFWASASFAPWGVINDYFENGQLFQPLFYGAPTDTMIARSSTLDKMVEEVFTKIIMGAGAEDEFEKFVENWNTLGGEQITKEVREWDKNR